MMQRSIKADNQKSYEEDLRIAFRVFDKDENGCVLTNEIRFILSHMSSEVNIGEIEEIVKYFDSDQDGKISFEDWWTVMSNNNKK